MLFTLVFTLRVHQWKRFQNVGDRWGLLKGPMSRALSILADKLVSRDHHSTFDRLWRFFMHVASCGRRSPSMKGDKYRLSVFGMWCIISPPSPLHTQLFVDHHKLPKVINASLGWASTYLGKQTRRLNVQKLIKIDHKRPLSNWAHGVDIVVEHADVLLRLLSEKTTGVVDAHIADRQGEDLEMVSGQRSKVNDQRSTVKIDKSWKTKPRAPWGTKFVFERAYVSLVNPPHHRIPIPHQCIRQIWWFQCEI